MPTAPEARKPDKTVGPLDLIVQLIAAAVADQLRPLLSGERPDALVDRKTCPYSRRWWDRHAGVTFPICKDGRRKVAKRSVVDSAFEQQQKLAPKRDANAAPPMDADETALLHAGIRLVRGRR